MKIYKNPFVARRSYFIAIAPARTGKMESKATQGYCIQEWQGQWEITRGNYYNISLRDEFYVVGEVSKKALMQAVIDLVLANVKDGDRNG